MLDDAHGDPAARIELVADSFRDGVVAHDEDQRVHASLFVREPRNAAADAKRLERPSPG